MPVPVTGAFAEAPSLPVMASVAAKGPAPGGLKLAERVQVAPGARELPHALDKVKAAVPVPVRTTEPICRLALPELEMVITCAGDTVPARWSGKAIALALRTR